MVNGISHIFLQNLTASKEQLQPRERQEEVCSGVSSPRMEQS